jgi:sugar lactone lactonase YvrE
MRNVGLAVFLLMALLGGAGAQAAASDLRLTGVRYPEGPLWLDGQLLFAEMSGDRVALWDGVKVSSWWRARGCGPTAIAPYRQGEFIILCHLGGYLVHVDRSANRMARFKKDESGRTLQDPNDATSDGVGGVYFSDAGVFRRGAPATGAIYHLSRDGRMERVATGLHYANGLYFDARSQRLYVSEHLARRILVFDVAANGALENRRVLAELEQTGPSLRWPYAESGPDGLELDGEGMLWVCEYGQGRILAIDQAGRVQGQVFVDATYLTNIAISGESRVALTGAFSNVRYPFQGEVRILPLGELRQAAAQASEQK